MSDYQIVGPFQSHRVIVDGRRVPLLEALPVNGDKISLLLVGRYGLDISAATKRRSSPGSRTPSRSRWVTPAPASREGTSSRQP
jgi:hypothetical protein